MIDTKQWSKDYDGWIGVNKMGFDIDEMNKNIQEYKPIATKVEFWNGYASVLVEDRNQMIPSMWLDYSIGNYGDPTCDWNQFIFYLKDAGDVEKKIYQDDSDVFELAESEGLDYLSREGYIKYDNDWGYEWTSKADMDSGDITYKNYAPRVKNVKAKDKYAERRARFSFGKKKKDQPVKSRNRKSMPPVCPRCGYRTDYTDLKYTDLDMNGDYFEYWRCDCPNGGFTITYNGPNDTYDWEFDE